MKFALPLLALAGLVAAQTQSLLESVPECARECLGDAVKNGTPCDLSDADCICEPDNYRNTYTVGQACVLQACGAVRSIEEVLPAAAGFCAAVTGGSAEITESGVPQPTLPASLAPESPSSTGAANATATGTGGSDSGAATLGRGGAWGVLALGALALL
ncbi:hypothetical protein VD0004_g7181 [Verticillium dahliae]|uniref:CFEM domain-containing protein n=1 Tax=Verticillium dahliae TaxID=27337 RepID=A0A444RZY6_VERDA|nr:hypothetical protein VD0004_g7181 [Verticillium dahliae]PNH69699.1 hypothetical protein VD0001_g7090 [Verticillium dahliae]RXG46703.1 hypothetical protein VDGE_30340 [Verticillium dahliae]